MSRAPLLGGLDALAGLASCPRCRRLVLAGSFLDGRLAVVEPARPLRRRIDAAIRAWLEDGRLLDWPSYQPWGLGGRLHACAPLGLGEPPQLAKARGIFRRFLGRWIAARAARLRRLQAELAVDLAALPWKMVLWSRRNEGYMEFLPLPLTELVELATCSRASRAGQLAAYAIRLDGQLDRVALAAAWRRDERRRRWE